LYHGPCPVRFQEAPMSSRQWVLLFTCVLVTPGPTHADKLVRIAGGGTEESNVPAIRAKLNQPFGIDFDKDGNFYLVELQGQRVLKVDTKGILTVAAGTGAKGNSGDGGLAKNATFNGMHSLAVPPTGVIFAADTWNNRVRKIEAGKIAAFGGSDYG